MILVNSPEFVKGVNEMGKILKISPHPNHLLILEAARKIISKRLNPDAIKSPNNVIVKVEKKLFHVI